MHFAALTSKGGKNAPPTLENRVKDKKPINALVQRLAKDHSSYAHSALGPFRGAGCWGLSSLSPLSPSIFFFSLSLLTPPLSVLFSKTDRMVWRASKVNLEIVGACEASLLR